MKSATTCPFCGSEHLYVTSFTKDDENYIYVKCDGCGAGGPVIKVGIKTIRTVDDVMARYTQAIEGAINGWNERK